MARVPPPDSFVPFAREEIEQSISRRFESHVDQNARRLAVKSGDQEINYEGLNELANRIAHALLDRRGDSPEPVATFLNPSLMGTAAALGILKAGKIWVPLDPSYPPARVAYMLEHSHAESVLTDSRQLAAIGGITGRSDALLNLDTLSEELPTRNPDLVVSPDALAYIIYTSGSTGQPKGIAQSNRNALHAAYLNINTFCISAEDRLPLLSSYGHISSVNFTLRALLTGASLFPFNVRETGASKLGEWLLDNRITVFSGVPTVFRHFIDNLPEPREFSDIRLIHLGGETVSRRDVDLYKRHFSPRCVFVNNLGSTEVSIYRQFVIDHETTLDNPVVPVGYEIPDKEVLLLDEDGQEVAPGEPGEIVVKSPYLAVEYWRQPEMTRRAFQSDPEDPRRRVFRTGDMARMLPDGCMVSAGRKDSQVKVRGERIEINEIEASLADDSSVRECAVVAWDWKTDEKRLVAYVVPVAGQSVSPMELREAVRRKLPEHMVPSVFLELEKFPLTPNGKIDRRALPEPEASELERATAYVAPRTPTERAIAEVWSEVFEIERIGADDHFLDLGGHSLMATLVTSRLCEIFDVELLARQVFEHPTVASLAGCVENELQKEPDADSVPLVPVSRDRDLPLSFSQQRLWFLDRFESGSAFYNLVTAVRMSGVIDRSALQKSIDRIVARHESLRTCFMSEEGDPVQVVSEVASLPLLFIDLSAFPADSRDSRALCAIQEEAQRPFDLSRDVMIRATLIRLAENEHALLIVVHHIASDGWSMGILFEELAAFYEAYSTGTPLSLAELPVQYADYSHWQRQRLQGEGLENHLSYWREKLKGARPVLEFPTDRPRPPTRSYSGGRETVVVSSELLTSLQTLCRSERVTLFAALLSTFEILLYRYTGQDDLIVGSPVAGRNRTELESMIGFFVNPLVLRADLSGNPSFRELLARIHALVLDAGAHQDLPFEKLVEELQPTRDLSHSPLFQVMFVLQDARRQDIEIHGVTLSHLLVDRETSAFDLTLFVATTGSGLRVIAEYNSDLFDRSTIRRLLGHYEVLLESIVDNPEQAVGELTLLSRAEEHQLLTEWNATQVEYSRDSALHTLFEAQVERRPSAVAAIYEGQKLTYGELNKRSNQLARYLRKLGVGPDVLVGICMERSLDMLVGLLGVMKAGGAYVPLDPSFPEDRLSFVVSDANVMALLVGERQLGFLRPGNADVICLEHVRDQIDKELSGNLDSSVTAENLAYVIYTSGSTGKPKGVQISHRATVNFLESMQEEPGLHEDDVLLSVTTLSFDISVLELFLPLITGAHTVLVSSEVGADGELLSRALSESGITVMQATPATWRVLVDSGWEGDRQLKMLCGGEALSRELADRLLELGGSLWNMYGPTETTVWSSVKRIETKEGLVRIGPPVANTQFYVLDQEMQPVPIGVSGELCIGGDGLARGYLNREELTRERFVENPFDDRAGSRLYKTGDSVRHLPNGDIEFLGRLDFQVKIRGFRIELGEIETWLRQHLGVDQAVVVAREDSSGDQRLVAYVVPSEGQTPSTGELRDYLKERLPQYMTPSLFVMLEELPLTPNGKIDRKALPEPSISVDADRSFVGARNAVEVELASIWQDVLKSESVGAFDDFFDLGGHSLLAVRVFAQIKKRFGVNLPLQTLFHASTIAALAEEIQNANVKEHWSPLVPIQSSGSRPPLFLVHGAGGNVLLYRDLAKRLGPDQPVYGLQAEGLNGGGDFLTDFRQIAERYVAEVQSFQPDGPYYLGGYCLGGALAYEMAQQLRRDGREVRLIAMLETYYAKRKRRPSFYRKFYHLLQNLKFHADNFFLLDARGKKSFLSEKVKVAAGRARGRLNTSLYRIFPNERLINDMDSLYIALTKRYEKALRSYQAEPYSGRVVLFRPNKVFRGSEDPSFGWSELIGDRLEVQTLPISPRGMLVDPLVRLLAEKLRECIDETLEEERPVFATQEESAVTVLR